MKKVMVLFLAVVMIMCLTACGDKSNTVSTEPKSTTSESQQDIPVQTENNTNTPNSSGEISLSDVMNAQESPESDFEIIDYEK